MENVSIQYSTRLTKKDYENLFLTIIEDPDPIECFEVLKKIHNDHNPSFSKNIQNYARRSSQDECFQLNDDDLMSDDMVDSLKRLWIDPSGDVISESEISDMINDVQRLHVKNINVTDRQFSVKSTLVYLELLRYIKGSADAVTDSSAADEIDEKKEKLFKYPHFNDKKEKEIIAFSVRERLALLKIFVNCSFLEPQKVWFEKDKNEYNNRYKIFLSIIMGVLPATFKKNPNPFLENFWDGTTEVQKSSVRETLAKMNKVTSKVRTQGPLKTAISNLNKALGTDPD